MAHIGIQIIECNTHPLSCIFRSTEYDGFCHSICCLKVSCNLSCYLLDSILDNDVVIVITVVIDPILNRQTINVQLALIGTPAIRNIGGNIYYFERRKESIFNSFFQAVGIHRLSKVMDIRYIPVFLGSCSHTDLRCRRKIFQDLSPIAVLFG